VLLALCSWADGIETEGDATALLGEEATVEGVIGVDAF
jgi:hypothetical protein